MTSRWHGGITRRRVVRAAVAGVAATFCVTAGAQGPTTGPPAPLRLASVTQWVVDQHRDAGPAGFHAAFRSALDGGVQDGIVFRWQRGRVQRDTLAPKPVRVLEGPEAQAVGGRGDVRLAALRPPRGAAAWTELDLVPGPGAAADAVAVIEIGGERNTERQVLETLALAAPDGTFTVVPLSLRALFAGPGVPVLRVPAGRVPTAASGFYRGPGGLELLVARSPVETVVNGGIGPGGLADMAPHPGGGSGDWRDADRLYIRAPLAALRAPAPAILLGWKDRILRPDPDGEFPRGSPVSGLGLR